MLLLKVWHWGALLAAAAILPGCIWNALGECDAQSRPLAHGEAVDGVSPDAIVEPLLGTHTAALHWTLAEMDTSLTVELDRADVARLQTMDCPSGDDRDFAVPVEVHIVSADGVISHDQPLTILLDRHGTIRQLEPLAIPLRYAELRAAGLTDPRTISGPSVRFLLSLDATTLAPADSSIDAVSSVTGTSSIANVDFP